MAGHQKHKVEKDTSERWLLTYSDLMNLLLILFIILYSMANVDAAKYQQVAQSIKAALGENVAATNIIGAGGSGASMIQLDASSPSPVMSSQLEDQQMQEVKDTVSDIIESQGLKGEVEVNLQERGVVISIREKVLFQSGSADIDPSSQSTIERIGKALLALNGKQIRVEGHTDSDPIKSSRFPDNQELSTARANSVWRILVTKSGIDPKLISATGYGEFRPKVANDTLEHKAENRRVDIAVLREAFDKSESGVSQTLTDQAQQPSGSTTTGAAVESAVGTEKTAPETVKE